MKTVWQEGRASLALCLGVIAVALPAAGRVVAEVDGRHAPVRPNPVGDYAVVASERCLAAPAWRAVIDALREKYAAAVVACPEGRLQDALPALRRQRPAYVCFVAEPEACDRPLVVAAHRLVRQLDDDPYGDALWGIVTGFDAADALRLAGLREPLVIRRGASSMGPGLLARLDAGFASNEDDVGDFWVKAAGSTAAVHKAVAPDATRALAEAFNAQPVEVFYTSGHATERDWQVAYNKPGGAFRHEAGELFAQSVDGARHAIRSPGAKVYLPVGNCLIGRIDRRDCMATAWLHSGGVGQMLGYTVVTFYGYMGWGTGMLFEDGRLSLAESFFLNNQSLLHRLAERFPEALAAQPEAYDGKDIAALGAGVAKGSRDALGLLWDRDTVAFYGDPAWVAAYPCSAPVFGWRLEEAGGLWTLRVTTLKAGGQRDPKWGARPFLAVLPERVDEVCEVACDRPVKPLVTERFALVPMDGAEAEGATATVTFRGRSAAR
jgi:zinc protease